MHMRIREAAVRTIVLPYGVDEYASVYFLGDWHVGSKGFASGRFASYRRRIIEDQHAYWVGMGDYADLITTTDPRAVMDMYEPGMYTPEALADPGKYQAERVIEEAEPMAHKCLGLLPGNHETKYKKHNLRSWFVNEIGPALRDLAPEDYRERFILDYEDWLILRFVREGQDPKAGTATCVCWLYHGSGGGQLKGAKALRQQRRAWRMGAAHLIVTAHAHESLAFPETAYEVDRRTGRVVARKVQTLLAGSFKLRGGWEVERELGEQVPGTGYAKLYPWRTLTQDRVRVSGFTHPDSVVIEQ